MDYRTYNDPPDAGYLTVPVAAHVAPVRLRACPHRPPPARAFCLKLRAAAEQLATDAAHTAALATAAEQAISRETAAAAAGDRAAVTKQDHALHSFSTSERAAARAQSAAGSAVAAVLRSKHLRYQLTAARSRKAVSGDLTLLARKGVPTAALRTLAPRSLRPRAADLLAGLSRPG